MNKILLFLGDAYFINGRVGVGTYHSNIINGLKKRYDIIVPSIYSAQLPKNANPIILSKWQRKKISLFKWFLPVSFFFKGYNCIITDSFSFKKGKSATRLFMIIHDCMCFTEPRNYTFLQRLYAHIASKSYKNADKIIAVSQSTRQTVHDLFHISYNKICLISNVTSLCFERKKAEHFLYIGDMRKTKNLYNLIKGFSLYLKQAEKNERLIICGRKKYEFDKLFQLVNDLDIKESVIFTGYVSEEEKIHYFENAKALLLLSDNEGFGIPLIEACTNEVPVICSDIPVFHEILIEEAAIFINNTNINAIADAFDKVQNKKITKEYSDVLRQKYSVQSFNTQFNEFITISEERL